MLCLYAAEAFYSKDISSCRAALQMLLWKEEDVESLRPFVCPRDLNVRLLIGYIQSHKVQETETGPIGYPLPNHRFHQRACS